MPPKTRKLELTLPAALFAKAWDLAELFGYRGLEQFVVALIEEEVGDHQMPEEKPT